MIGLTGIFLAVVLSAPVQPPHQDDATVLPQYALLEDPATLRRWIELGQIEPWIHTFKISTNERNDPYIRLELRINLRVKSELRTKSRATTKSCMINYFPMW
jgi:hypothetical protein